MTKKEERVSIIGMPLSSAPSSARRVIAGQKRVLGGAGSARGPAGRYHPIYRTDTRQRRRRRTLRLSFVPREVGRVGQEGSGPKPKVRRLLLSPQTATQCLEE